MEIRAWLSVAAFLFTERAASSSLLVKRFNDSCPTSGLYSAPIGLSFDVFCRQDLTGRVITTVQTPSIQECMDQCSIAQTELCYGVSYDPASQRCSLRNSQAARSTTGGNNTFHSAIGRITAKQNTCQFPNATVQRTQSGMTFDIRCQQDMRLNDYCPTTSPYQPTGPSPNLCPQHAETLQDCMEICSRSQPLCRAVSFSPTMAHGFGNCYTKSDVAPNMISFLAATQDVNHMAIANNINSAVTDCPDDTNVTSSDQRNFRIHCDRDSVGFDIQVMHQDTLQACVEACATVNRTIPNANCTGVSYDPMSSRGFQNCNLKSVINRPLKSQRGGIIAVLPGALNGTSSRAPTTDSGDSGPSMVWIAGPIGGGIVVALAGAGFIIWCTRRKKAKKKKLEMMEKSAAPVVEVDDRDKAPMAELQDTTIGRRDSILKDKKHELGTHEEIHEIGSSNVRLVELPG